mmetsp:Transcript_47710/g.74447  ORF Transcript_47710/g.74447 Transcript_47710/m.74447 type:complete len:177 (+) Transcript_47710:3-533(+)
MFALGSRYVAEKYQLEPHHMGYLSSYNSIVSLVCQTYLVAIVAQRFGEERCLQIAFASNCILAITESCFVNIYLYVALVPFKTLAGSLISQMFESILTTIVPKSETAGVLGTLGLLKAIARVGGPIYGGLLLGYLGPTLGNNARPVVEATHDCVVLVTLLMCYPLVRQTKEKSKTD